MKITSFIIIFISQVLVCQNTKSKINFTAKIENRNSDTLTIFNLQDEIISKIVNTNGVFKDAFESNTEIHVLFDGKLAFPLFLEENGTSEVSFDANNIEESLVFKGGGSKESYYLKYKRISDFEFEKIKVDLLNKNKIDFENAIQEKLTKELEDLESKYFHHYFVDLVKGKIISDIEIIKKDFYRKLLLENLIGNISPTFDYENHKGGKTKLEDLRGKYVYIDVWATWCGPCLAEIPHLKKVEEKYHGKNIEFVSISVDTDKDHEKWKKMVVSKELGGIQLFADNNRNSDFIKAYDINIIPRFILIGPDGKVIKADAPRPSSASLIELLDGLVK